MCLCACVTFNWFNFNDQIDFAKIWEDRGNFKIYLINDESLFNWILNELYEKYGSRS